MPSNFTENYNLNQWAKDDRVLMEDFNADNAKLDAALAGKADRETTDELTARADAQAAGQCMFRLLNYTVPQDTATLKLDLSGLDLGQYTLVKLMLYVRVPTSTASLRMRFNKLSAGYWNGSSDTTSDVTLFGNSYHGRLANISLWGNGPDNTWLTYDKVCPNPNEHSVYVEMGGCKNITLDQLTSLNFFYNSNNSETCIPAGSWFRLYGIK